MEGTILPRYLCSSNELSRASANLQMDLSQVLKLAKAWSQRDLITFASKLTGSSDNSANSGELVGTWMFWSLDYLVSSFAHVR